MRVLIAEDDRATQLRLKTDTASWGYEPVIASNGAEAWELFQGGDFPIVISDWMMPQMDGLELVRRIREHSPGGYVFIIMLTAQGDTSRLVEGMDAGADDFVAKPFDRDELRVRLSAGRRIVELEQRLASSNAELSAFTSVASHDLREPLRTMTSFLGLLCRELGDGLSDNARDYVEFINDAAKRMQALIDDLLAFSRLDKAPTEPSEDVPLAEVVDEKLALLQTAIDECGAQIECGALPQVRGDRSQLSQLMQNLISNAIKYRGEASPVVRIESGDDAEAGAWWVSVSDNGIGIPAEHRDEVFQPFRRLHGKGSEYSGSGVGLAICQKVVDRHGGRIWIEDSELGGSKFVFTLAKPDG